MGSFDWTLSLLLSLLLLFLVFSGCAESERQGHLGEWTVKTNELTLRQDLQVSETENFIFGSIADLDVTTDGHIVVLDGDAKHLKVLERDGTLIDTLGRPGNGPGEFRGPRTVDVARGDSIYVYDTRQNRLSVYTPPPSVTLDRSVLLSGSGGNLTKARVVGDRLAGYVTPGYTRKEGLYRPEPATWRVIGEGGRAGDTLTSVQRKKVATSFDGPGVVIAYLPFGRITHVAPGPDGRLYHGHTDELRVDATSMAGRTRTIADVPVPSIPVTGAERDSALAEIPSRIRPPIASAFPEMKPAFTDLFVADDGRLWIRRPTDRLGAEQATWWILDPGTKTIHEVQLPAEVDLDVETGGRAYGKTTTKAGAPAIVRYAVDIDV